VPAIVGKCPPSVSVGRAQEPGPLRVAAPRNVTESTPCCRPKRPRATDGKTPRITDRTIGARVRLPWGERGGAASTDLGRVEGVATHRHKRCFDLTRGPQLQSSSSSSSCQGRSLLRPEAHVPLTVQAASYAAGDRLVGAGGCWECATVAEPAVCAARDGVLDAV